MINNWIKIFPHSLQTNPFGPFGCFWKLGCSFSPSRFLHSYQSLGRSMAGLPLPNRWGKDGIDGILRPCLSRGHVAIMVWSQVWNQSWDTAGLARPKRHGQRKRKDLPGGAGVLGKSLKSHGFHPKRAFLMNTLLKPMCDCLVLSLFWATVFYSLLWKSQAHKHDLPGMLHIQDSLQLSMARLNPYQHLSMPT